MPLGWVAIVENAYLNPEYSTGNWRSRRGDKNITLLVCDGGRTLPYGRGSDGHITAAHRAATVRERSPVLGCRTPIPRRVTCNNSNESYDRTALLHRFLPARVSGAGGGALRGRAHRIPGPYPVLSGVGRAAVRRGVDRRGGGGRSGGRRGAHRAPHGGAPRGGGRCGGRNRLDAALRPHAAALRAASALGRIRGTFRPAHREFSFGRGVCHHRSGRRTRRGADGD